MPKRRASVVKPCMIGFYVCRIKSKAEILKEKLTHISKLELT